MWLLCWPVVTFYFILNPLVRSSDSLLLKRGFHDVNKIEITYIYYIQCITITLLQNFLKLKMSLKTIEGRMNICSCSNVLDTDFNCTGYLVWCGDIWLLNICQKSRCLQILMHDLMYTLLKICTHLNWHFIAFIALAPNTSVSCEKVISTAHQLYLDPPFQFNSI